MTYTSQIPTGSSVYSPFNKTSAQAPIPKDYGFQANGPAATSPAMASDSFVPPSSPDDIDRVSSNIDDKIARIRQAFSQGQTGGMAPPSSSPSAPPVSQQEIQWAMQLEAKVKGGQQPSAQEAAQYEDIAKRLQASQQPAAAQPAAPQATPVSQQEIQWAMQIEAKVKSGQAATPQETAKYEDIAKRLQAAQQPAAQQPAAQNPSGPRNWSAWSKPFASPTVPNMPQPIASPSGKPMLNVPTSLRGAPQTAPGAGMQNVPARLTAPAANQSMRPQAALPPQQAAAPPQMAGVSQQEVQWALDLEEKFKQGHQPSPQETAQYNSIAQRIQASMAQQQAPVGTAQQTSPQRPVAPQQQATPQMAGVSQQEVQWALQLEQKVKQNYQPQPQEIAQYNNIAQRLQAGAQPAQAPQATQPRQQAPLVPIVPQNYPHVQARTPQTLMPPQQQLQQPLYGQQPRTAPAPQQFPAYGTQGTPGTPPPPGGQFPAQNIPGPQASANQAPGFTDRLKNAWGALWG